MKPSRSKTKTERHLTAVTKAQKTASKLVFFSEDDPDGSYTGVPENINDTPVQDVDDL